MARAARFRIWESKMRRGRFYRETVLGKRAKATAPDQHFPTLKAAIANVTEEWIAMAKALGVYGTHTKATFLATHPVPWATGSLVPKLKLTSRARKAVKTIQREAAIEKIVEGAKIGKISTQGNTVIGGKGVKREATPHDLGGPMMKARPYISPTMKKKLAAEARRRAIAA